MTKKKQIENLVNEVSPSLYAKRACLSLFLFEPIIYRMHFRSRSRSHSLHNRKMKGLTNTRFLPHRSPPLRASPPSRSVIHFIHVVISFSFFFDFRLDIDFVVCDFRSFPLFGMLSTFLCMHVITDQTIPKGRRSH